MVYSPGASAGRLSNMRTTDRWCKKRISINHDTWTPIAPPLDFDYVALRCDTSEVTLRTALNDAGTEDTLEPNVQDGVMGAQVLRYFHNSEGTFHPVRFKKDLPICFVKSTAASATLVVTWVL